MVAARLFVTSLQTQQLLDSVARIEVALYGSLGATGKGHGSDKAVLLGLMGETPEAVDVGSIPDVINTIKSTQKIILNHTKSINFDEQEDLLFYRKESLPRHANGLQITAFDTSGNRLQQNIYYSVGGGFVVDEHCSSWDETFIKEDEHKLPYSFTTAEELLKYCKTEGLSISQIMMENEQTWRSRDEISSELLSIWQLMQDCVEQGCNNSGILPGGLKVKRRAAELCESLKDDKAESLFNQGSMDWVNLYALAVNEENAAGGRVVTAPTNGAAGIMPAVMLYYKNFCSAYGLANKAGESDQGEAGIVRFMLTAGAIGMLIKQNASISGAEVGCQGEVGSASAMAAAGLTEVLGGTPEQVENAAEIGIEHNLGLTCDPIAGLVQIPCIERNAMGAVKAINASRMALRGDGTHYVSLDKVIHTMRETGKDMRSKYKETARGGLALDVIDVPVSMVEC
jgi:L-serine dehydratase